MRDRTGKSARMAAVDFDSNAVNSVHDAAAEAEEAKLKEEVAKEAAAKADAKAAEEAELEAKAEAALASHDSVADKSKEADKPA